MDAELDFQGRALGTPSCHSGDEASVEDLQTTDSDRGMLGGTARQMGASEQQQQYYSSAPPYSPVDVEVTQRRLPPSGFGQDSPSYFGQDSPSYSKFKKGKGRARSGSNNYLPVHRRRRNSSSWSWSISARQRRRLLTLVAVVLVCLFGVLYVHRTYEFQFEMAVFSRAWVKNDVDKVWPLKGCFNSAHLSTEYNITQHRAPKRHMLSPGISLRRGLSCYDYASTIKRQPDEPTSDLTFHTYWRSDLEPFNERQAATLEGFLATQPLSHSKLILWSNDAKELSHNPHIMPFLQEWGHHIEVRQVDMPTLTRGTEIDGLLGASNLFDNRAWVDGDALRLLVLWHYGGIWMDMDMLLTRPIHLLTESEFLIQWDCYDKAYSAMNGALMHFRKHSPYLCEAFHLMATLPLPAQNSVTWGSHLYAKLHRSLLAAKVRPFAVLPWCFADPRNCRSDVRFPDPFKPDPSTWGGSRWDGQGAVGPSGRELLEEKTNQVFSIHLHNQWRKQFPQGGWVNRLLERYRERIAGLRKKH